jgi:hypothetical protein
VPTSASGSAAVPTSASGSAAALSEAGVYYVLPRFPL